MTSYCWLLSNGSLQTYQNDIYEANISFQFRRAETPTFLHIIRLWKCWKMENIFSLGTVSQDSSLPPPATVAAEQLIAYLVITYNN